MSGPLFPYYERELIFIRQFAQDFAARYPAAAGRLLLEPNRSGDPHVERMIESFALLAGRIHHKLDDEFPELTEALLGVLYPHYLAPVPSLGIVEFQLDPTRGPLPDGFRIARHSRLQTARVGNLPCRFRTGYPVKLWPVELTQAMVQSPPFPREFEPPRRTAAALRLQFECQSELKFSQLSLDDLRFYLFGDAHIVTTLYELIFNHATQVVFRSLEPELKLSPIVMSPAECLGQVGFDAADGLLPYPPQSFLGYRLLSEFFAMREKFLFMDLKGFAKAAAAGFQRKMEVVVYLDHTVPRVEEWIDRTTFRMGCTPIINLFEQVAEPIALDQGQFEYRVVPDVANQRGMEVYSIDEVISVDPATSTTTVYRPFYSFHHRREGSESPTFWHSSRKISTQEGDRGTEVFLHLVDLEFQPQLPADETLVVRTTCTNRDLPNQLQHAGERLYFELEGAAPLSGIRCLKTPTTPLRAPGRRGRYWSLVSHLTLNYLSLADPVQGRDALCEILRLYDFSDPQAGQQQLADVTRQLIEGIVRIHTRRIVGRTGSQASSGFSRGMEVVVELDEEKYIGTGTFLFACVLERFMGLYAAINSFTQFGVKTTQSEGLLKKWPLRAGEQALI
jgi:type VI secretion system protein ImpG